MFMFRFKVKIIFRIRGRFHVYLLPVLVFFSDEGSVLPFFITSILIRHQFKFCYPILAPLAFRSKLRWSIFSHLPTFSKGVCADVLRVPSDVWQWLVHCPACAPLRFVRCGAAGALPGWPSWRHSGCTQYWNHMLCF